jgi:hypothetical protein
MLVRQWPPVTGTLRVASCHGAPFSPAVLSPDSE